MALLYYMHAYYHKYRHIVKLERHGDIDTPKSVAVRPLIVGTAGAIFLEARPEDNDAVGA